MLNPIGRSPENGLTSLADGLIGFFPCEIPLVNIITPTYITDNSTENITTYNYAINKVANPSMITDISGKMRWINKTNAIKGNVGTKFNGSYRGLPSLVSAGYGCENDFSMFAIINKHGNAGITYDGSTSLYFVFMNLVSNKEECLLVDISNTSIGASYGEVSETGSITAIASSSKPSSLQIESPHINIKRTGFYTYDISVSDSLGEILLDTSIDNVEFKTIARFKTTGTNEITNIRTYSRTLTNTEHIELCKTGDCKSKYYVLDNSFMFSYNESTQQLTVEKTIDDIYPLGTARVISKAGFASNDSHRGVGSGMLDGVDGIGEHSTINDPAVIASNLNNGKSLYVDNIPAYIDINNNESKFFIVDNKINLSNSMFSYLAKAEYYSTFVQGNKSIFFGLIHHGYIFVTVETDKEYIKKLMCNTTTPANVTSLKYGTKILAPNETIVYNGSTVYNGNHYEELTINIGTDCATGHTYRVYTSTNGSAYASSGYVALYPSTTSILISSANANSSVLVEIYDAVGNIKLIKNIEFRLPTVLAMARTPFSDHNNSYCVKANRGSAFIQGCTVNRVQGNRGKENYSYSYASYHTCYTIANTTYNDNDMIVEFNTDIYDISEFQSNLLTVYEEVIASGALLNYSIVSKNVGTCTGISYIYNEYMNESYSDTIVQTSGETANTMYNLIDEHTTISNGSISITQSPGSMKNLKIVFGQVFPMDYDLTAYSIGQYVSGFKLLSAKAININIASGNYYICFGSDGFYKIRVNSDHIVAEKEKLELRDITSNENDVLNALPIGLSNSIEDLYELIITKERITDSIMGLYISINSLDGTREYRLPNPIAEGYDVSTVVSVNMPGVFEINEFNSIGVIGTRLDTVFSKVRSCISNYVYFLPKPTLFMTTSNQWSSYVKTERGSKHQSYYNGHPTSGNTVYDEVDYNFENIASIITLSKTYGVNRFCVPFSSNMIPDGYVWYENDTKTSPSPDYNMFDIGMDKNEIQTITPYLPIGLKNNVKILFTAEHLSSDINTRKTPSFLSSDINFNTYGGKCKIVLRIRHPISKRCIETPIYIYGESELTRFIKAEGVLSEINNNETIRYLAPMDCMIDFDSSIPVIVNDTIKNIHSDKKTLFFYTGKSKNIKLYNTIEQSVIVQHSGNGFSIFKITKNTSELPRLYFKKEYDNKIYKPDTLEKFCLNTVVPTVFNSDFDMLTFFTYGDSGTFQYCGVDSSFNWGVSNITIDDPDPIMYQASVDTSTSDYVPNLYLTDRWNVQTYSSTIEYDLYQIFNYIAATGSSRYYTYDNQYQKSWIHKLYVDNNISIQPQVSEDNFIVNCHVGTTFIKAGIGYTTHMTVIGDSMTFDVQDVKNSYIATVQEIAGCNEYISVIIPSLLEPTTVYKSKENQYKVSKSNNEITYIKNKMEYTVSDKSQANTRDVREDFDEIDKFIIKTYGSDSNWHILDLKRNLGSIITTRTKTPTSSTQYDINGWLTNNPVVVTSVGALVPIKESSLVWGIQDKTYVIYKGNDSVISQAVVISLFSTYGLDDSHYRISIDSSEHPKDSLVSRNDNVTTSYKVSVFSYDKNDSSILEGSFYTEPYKTSIKVEVIEYYEEEIRITEETIKYNKKIGGDTTLTNVYAITDTGRTAIKSAVGDLDIRKSDLINEDSITAIEFEDVCDTTYFGDNFIIKRTQIPYNDVEILSKVTAGCTDFYDFYGKSYKYYNKINLLEQATITQCDVIEKNRIGIYAKEILTPYINSSTNNIKQIVFLVKYDVMNIFNKSDSSFSFTLIDSLNNSNTILTDTNLSKDEKWQLISVSITDDGNKFNITKFNDTTHLWETIVPSSNIGIGNGSLFKLSIKNNRWLFCGLMITTTFDTTYSDTILSKLNGEQNISISNNTYKMKDLSYYYYNEDPSYSVKKTDCTKQYNESVAETQQQLIYGKFQEIVNRQTSSDLILRDRVFSYRNVPDNKLMSNSEKEIGIDATSVSFNVYCQKLGTNELNNPVIFISASMNVVENIPLDNSYYYIGCLIDDYSDDSILVEQYAENIIFTYNSFLPTDGYVYEEGSLAILGREVVAIKRLLPATVKYNNKEYVVLELDREYMNTSMSFNQKLPVQHFSGENIRSVYDFSSDVASYEFVDSMCDGDNNVFNISRTGGNCVLKEEIYKFNKFTTLSGRYEIDKGCAMYLFEGHSDNTVLQSTMFIENIQTDPKESEINISLKNKMDMIYDYNIINYKTLENISVADAIKEIVFPYINTTNNNIVMSSSMYSISEQIDKIKTMELSSYTSVGEALDSICNCGYNIWIDENERFLIDNDMYTKPLCNGIRLEYDNGMTSMNKISVNGKNYYGYALNDYKNIDGYNDLTEDFVISERDSLITNKIDIDHENTVPMYSRDEYVINDKIYPINCLKIMSDVKYDNYSTIVHLDDSNTIKPSVQELSLSNTEFNKTKSKIGVMCVLRRGDYELQYKMIKAERES